MLWFENCWKVRNIDNFHILNEVLNRNNCFEKLAWKYILIGSSYKTRLGIVPNITVADSLGLALWDGPEEIFHFHAYQLETKYGVQEVYYNMNSTLLF